MSNSHSCGIYMHSEYIYNKLVESTTSGSSAQKSGRGHSWLANVKAFQGQTQKGSTQGFIFGYYSKFQGMKWHKSMELSLP